MDIKNLVVSNQALEAIDNGAWVDNIDNDPEFCMRVRGLRSDVVRKAREAKEAKKRASKRGKELTDEEKTVIFKEVLIEVVLLEWKGLDDEGTAVPYSQELAREWIMSRNGENFTTLVVGAAQSLDANPEEFIEAAAKN